MVTLPPSVLNARHDIVALVALLGGGDTTRIVGGAVRDSLIGLPVSDVDLATRRKPDAVIASLNAAGIKVVPTGIAHGTITAVLTLGPVEITTLRRDVATDGRHAIVSFSDDWCEDAARRDFTINALYADAVTGVIDDYFGGLADLHQRRVRFIGDPSARIAEDHLRILRFFRFHARFGLGAPDPDGLAACTARANDLMALSRERIAAEMLKLLGGPDPTPTIAIMIAHGILLPVLPEITDAAPLARLIAREREAGVAADPLRRLASLISAEVAHDVATRLKFSRSQVRRLSIATSQDAPSVRALAYRFGNDSATDLVLLGDRDPGALDDLKDWKKPVLGISGGDLIARGLPVGPIVAHTLQAIENEWVDARFPTGPGLDAIVAQAISRAI